MQAIRKAGDRSVLGSDLQMIPRKWSLRTWSLRGGRKILKVKEKQHPGVQNANFHFGSRHLEHIWISITEKRSTRWTKQTTCARSRSTSSGLCVLGQSLVVLYQVLSILIAGDDISSRRRRRTAARFIESAFTRAKQQKVRWRST